MREYFIGGLFNKSKKTTETVLNATQVTKNTSAQLQKNISENTSLTTNKQTLNVKVVVGGNMMQGCDFNTNQSASISKNLTNSLMAQQLADMSTDVAKEMANNLESELTQGSLALGESSTTDNTKITTRLENIVEREMSQENISKTLENTITIQEQNGELEVKGDCYAPITFTQEAVIDTAVINTIDAVVDAIMKDQELTEMTNDLASRLESKGVIGETGELLESAGTGISTAAEGVGTGISTAGKGVGEGVGTAAEGVGEGIGNAFGGGTSVIIAIVIVCLILLGVGAYFMFGME